MKPLVFKFGGAALASAERIHHAARVTLQCAEGKPVLVVASAMQGVTDRLYHLAEGIQARNDKCIKQGFNQLAELHLSTAQQLASNDSASPEERIKSVLRKLAQTIACLRDQSVDPQAIDSIVSFGERFSAILLSAAIRTEGNHSLAVDSADLLVATPEFGNAKILLADSAERIARILPPLLHETVVPVVTGYYAATHEGHIVTLGRSGSDYTATSLAAVLSMGNGIRCESVTLWKDEAGVYDQDPRQHSKAKLISHLGYLDAAELAAGAKVLHYETVEPVMTLGIPIRVKDFNNPQAEGTRIGPEMRLNPIGIERQL